MLSRASYHVSVTAFSLLLTTSHQRGVCPRPVTSELFVCSRLRPLFQWRFSIPYSYQSLNWGSHRIQRSRLRLDVENNLEQQVDTFASTNNTNQHDIAPVQRPLFRTAPRQYPLTLCAMFHFTIDPSGHSETREEFWCQKGWHPPIKSCRYNGYQQLKDTKLQNRVYNVIADQMNDRLGPFG